MEPLHRLFKALADPNRLRIINMLLEEPFCVCELEAVLGLPQSLISRHLAYLRSAGMVRDQRQGMRVRYSLSTEHAVVRAFEPCLREVLLSERVHRHDVESWRQMVAARCTSEKAIAGATKGEVL